MNIDRPLRISFIVTSASTAKTFLHGYLNQIARAGFEVTLISSPDEGLKEFSDREGVNLISIPMRRDPSLPNDLVSLLRLRSAIKSLRSDIVVYATPKASLLASIASWSCGVRTRIYEHWGLRLESLGGFKRHALYLLEWLTCRLSTHIVPNSPSLASRLKELNLGASAEIRVLGNGSSHGVDLQRFDASSPELRGEGVSAHRSESSGKFVVGFVGRLHPDKGVDVLLNALDAASAHDQNIVGLMVGGHEGAFGSESLDELEARHPVHFVGRVADPRPYFAAMDVLVLMSLREGFPNVVLEAAAMGVPSIVAASTGTRDSVIDQETGVILPVGDAPGLAAALIELAGNPTRCEYLGRRARKEVELHYGADYVRGLHVDFFRCAYEGK